MIKDFILLGAITSRTLTYINILKTNNLLPKYFILYGPNKKLKLYKKIESTFKNLIFIKTNNVNSKILFNKIIDIPSSLTIFSGYPSEIIDSSILNIKNKVFLHSHSGKLPFYKGSTTIYYSLLNIKKIYCSTIIMSDKIDDGKILCIKEYPIPNNLILIESEYDNKIRIENIIYTLTNYHNLIKKNKSTKLKNHINHYYYIAHPAIRSIAIEKYNRNKKRPLLTAF